MNSEKKIQPLLAISVIVAFFCTVCGIVLRIINILNFYDTKIGYFQSNAWTVAMNIFFVSAVAIFAFLCLMLEHKKLLCQTTNTSIFFKTVCAVCSVITVIQAFNTLLDAGGSATKLALALAMIGSAVYFALYLSKSVPTYNALLALFPTLACTLILGITYFDTYIQMNSPHKLLIHIACIACMLAFVGEARILADQKRRKTYFWFVAVALFFTGVSSIPSITLYFSNSFNYPYIDCDLILFIFFLYFASRMTTLCVADKKENISVTAEDEQTESEMPENN